MPGTRNRRDILLTAALDGFTRRGYDATSVAELAAATGMSKAAVSSTSAPRTTCCTR